MSSFKRRLGPYTVTVRFVDKLPDKTAVGMWQPESFEILIQSGMSKLETLDTFVHECVEAVNAVYGLELPHPIIQTLGVALAQMLDGKVKL